MAKLDFTGMTNGTEFDGEIGIRTMSIGQTKNGNDYIFGTMINGRNTWQFKVWDKAVVAGCKTLVQSEAGFKPFVAAVIGNVGMYNGELDYTLKSVSVVTDMDFEEFVPTLDIAANFKAFSEFINNNIAPNYIQVLMSVMSLKTQQVFDGVQPTSETTIMQLLKTAWAASGNHDAIRGGLINHTYKMLRIAKTVIENNAGLVAYKDLLYTGIILHDIGKVQEIQGGVYTKNSFVSHRVMGIEYMAMLKSFIVSQIGIDMYYRLLDIIIGHHDQFGTPAATTWAYLVHLIDMLDTWATMFEQDIQSPRGNINQNNERIYKAGGKNLTV